MKKALYVLSRGMALGMVLVMLLVTIETIMYKKEVLYFASLLADSRSALVAGTRSEEFTYLELHAKPSSHMVFAIVDTGATSSIVSRNTMLRWREEGAVMETVDAGAVTTAGGQQILVFIAHFAQLTVAGCTLHDVVIRYADDMLEVVGQDILERLQAVVFPTEGKVAIFNCNQT